SPQGTGPVTIYSTESRIQSMEQASPGDRLSQISTLWSMFQQAHEGSPEQAGAASRELLARYGGAVYRYLLGALRDPDAASDLSRESAWRFVRGDCRRADAGRGRFRDYLKTALSHLITDHHRQQQDWPETLSPEGTEPAAPTDSVEDSAVDF